MPMFNNRDHRKAARPQNTVPPPRRLRALLVDENPTARSVVARRLSHLGYDVLVAEDGHQALGLLAGRPMDVVLIDMNVRRVPAILVMRRIREANLAANACFVMIAAREDNQSAIDALAAGADDHIVKPYDFDLLDVRLRHLCRRADAIGALTRHNADLDARIARRAVELGETRDALREMELDRARLVSSIQALNDQIERLQSAQA